MESEFKDAFYVLGFLLSGAGLVLKQYLGEKKIGKQITETSGDTINEVRKLSDRVDGLKKDNDSMFMRVIRYVNRSFKNQADRIDHLEKRIERVEKVNNIDLSGEEKVKK